MSEIDLLQRIQPGDTKTFRELYDAYAPVVYRYAMVRISTPQDAEDLTAETFLRAWQAISSFQWRGTSIGAWLLRITHNLIVDKYRRKQDLLGWLPWRHAREERQFEHQFERIEQQDVIKRAFETLSYNEQMIIYLHFFEGYTLTEVAEFMKKSPNAVRVAQFRALRRLREALQHADA